MFLLFMRKDASFLKTALFPSVKENGKTFVSYKLTLHKREREEKSSIYHHGFFGIIYTPQFVYKQHSVIYI